MVVALLLVVVATAVATAAAASDEEAGRPSIAVLGTLDVLLVETTPVSIAGELWLFESVRPDYWRNEAGLEYLAFVHMASGRTSSPFGAGHGLGSAIVDYGPCPPSGVCGVFAFGTRRTFGGAGGGAEQAAGAAAAPAPAPGQVISVFWSTDGMHTWYNKTAIDFSKDTKVPGRSKRVVFNTSVGKGKLNGTVVYIMAYEWSRAGTPGGWNTNFAMSTDLLTWELLPEEYSMPAGVEHADPTLRYVDSDGYWYCIPARKDPTRWYFFQVCGPSHPSAGAFLSVEPGRCCIIGTVTHGEHGSCVRQSAPQEIYRSRDLRSWEAAPGMGSPTAVGRPLLVPNAVKDRALAPKKWHPSVYDELSNPRGRIQNWTQWEDCNSSDMDLCEWRNQTIMVFNWGCQHTTEAIALAVSPMPLDAFLQAWFTQEQKAPTSTW